MRDPSCAVGFVHRRDPQPRRRRLGARFRTGAGDQCALGRSRVGIRNGLARNLVGILPPRSQSSFERDSARAEHCLEAIEAIRTIDCASAWDDTSGFKNRWLNRGSSSRRRSRSAQRRDGQWAAWLDTAVLRRSRCRFGEAKTCGRPTRPTLGVLICMGWCIALSQIDLAIDLRIQSRAANPRPWVTHLGLLELWAQRQLDGARLARGVAYLHPGIAPLARIRATARGASKLLGALREDGGGWRAPKPVSRRVTRATSPLRRGSRTSPSL